MTVITIVAVGMFILFLLLVFLPKGKKAQAAQEPVLNQYVPQYFPQYAPPPPTPQLTPRQLEVQEKVRVLSSYFVDVDEAAFKKKVVDEAVALLTQGK